MVQSQDTEKTDDPDTHIQGYFSPFLLIDEQNNTSVFCNGDSFRLTIIQQTVKQVYKRFIVALADRSVLPLTTPSRIRCRKIRIQKSVCSIGMMRNGN